MNIKNKNKYGEVFTPKSLIDETLNHLPDKVWTNPNFKWLDPCAGKGTYMLYIYQRLMEGLKEYEPNNAKRSSHIQRNMLFMVELNPNNAQITKSVFGLNTNIFCGDFLKDDWYKYYNIDKYDIILGNPPWNDSKDSQRTGTNSGSKTLYDKFVFRSLNILKYNGYLAFIHPANWRGLGRHYDLWLLLSSKQLLYIHIYGKKQGFEIFDVDSRFDLYVLQNKKNTKKTKIIDENGNIQMFDLLNMPFLPNFGYDLFENILTSEENGINVIQDNFFSTHKTNTIIKSTKDEIYKYPVIHTITKKGVKLYYTNDNTKGHFGIKKVILSFNEKQYDHNIQNDYKGMYGMSQICFGIPIKNKAEGERILKAIKTPKFQSILESTKWSLFQTDYRMFRYFKKDFYKYF